MTSSQVLTYHTEEIHAYMFKNIQGLRLLQLV